MRTTHKEFFSRGVRLAGDLYEPDPDAANGAAVVLCHGYTGVKGLYFPEISARLVDAGYAVFAFDYRGWGESDGRPGVLDPYGRVDDTQAAITCLLSTGASRTGTVSLFGWSFGGSVALVAGALDERVESVVSVFAVGDGERWLRSTRTDEEWRHLRDVSDRDRIRRSESGSSEIVARDLILKLDEQARALSAAKRTETTGATDELPLEYVTDTVNFVPELFLGRLAPRPLLVIASDVDTVVPYEESASIFAKASEPKELVRFSRYGHYDLYQDPALGEVIGAAVTFLNGIHDGDIGQ